MSALFDTNILIDYLNEVAQARAEISRYTDRAISIVTWVEVMVGADASVAEPTKHFLAGFHLIEFDERIAERAVQIRRARRMKLPDAVIWASAQVSGRLLVTRNTKDFPLSEPGVREPYSI